MVFLKLVQEDLLPIVVDHQWAIPVLVCTIVPMQEEWEVIPVTECQWTDMLMEACSKWEDLDMMLMDLMVHMVWEVDITTNKGMVDSIIKGITAPLLANINRVLHQAPQGNTLQVLTRSRSQN
jgi:hypothetical protein